MRLGKSYGAQRLEAAASRALACGACTYSSVKSILGANLDQVPLEPPAEESTTPAHQNLRGPDYYAKESGQPC